jgi:putative transcriptional regulator
MTLTTLADAGGISLVNLNVMRNNRARAIGYSTLTVICPVLVCQPGERLSVAPPLSFHRRTWSPSLLSLPAEPQRIRRGRWVRAAILGPCRGRPTPASLSSACTR